MTKYEALISNKDLMSNFIVEGYCTIFGCKLCPFSNMIDTECKAALKKSLDEKVDKAAVQW